MYMVTKIISGKVIERRKSYCLRRPVKRGGRIQGNTTERKLENNREGAALQLARVLNCNFSAGDVWLTLSLHNEALRDCGGTAGGAMALAMRFIRKLCYRAKKRGVTVRWVVAKSDMDGESGDTVRPHIHLVMSGDGFRMEDGVLYYFGEAVDGIWGSGSVDVQFLRHQKDYYPLAKYIIAQTRRVKDEKKYSTSRNMKKPVIHREIVLTGAPLRVPAGATVLTGTKFDPEKGQNIVRYIPREKDPDKQVGGHRELTRARAGEEDDA